ncbi:hypothetical protein GCM10027423_63760 [Spirosoma arcticum]
MIVNSALLIVFVQKIVQPFFVHEIPFLTGPVPHLELNQLFYRLIKTEKKVINNLTLFQSRQ